LERDFNAAADQLERALANIVGGARTIGTATREIVSAADDLSRRTEQQAANLEETVAAIKEITTTFGKTAEGARHASDAVSMARADAEKSGDVVHKAVEAMSRIEKSSQDIGQIISVIDEIAFQTNLLALNAGVEAARAGEAGRGFAVVACEVRSLAQRSAEASKEIKKLISMSTSEVEEGVGLVMETGKALERIVAQVADINQLIGEMATGASEQSMALQQINAAVGRMDQDTQKNAAMVEETTAATHQLRRETEELVHSVKDFTIDEADSLRQADSKASAKPTTRTALKNVAGAGGAAVRKNAPEVAEENWDEF
jgi:methyl-accepting chemotaxis protein